MNKRPNQPEEVSDKNRIKPKRYYDIGNTVLLINNNTLNN
jgi:hypothetical protein